MFVDSELPPYRPYGAVCTQIGERAVSGMMFFLAGLAVALVLAIGVASVGNAAVDRSRASSAADAAALAGAAAGADAASATAALNNAELMSTLVEGERFRAVVRVGDAIVEASAERYFVPAERGTEGE